MPTPARIRNTLATITAQPDELRELRAYHKALADVTRLRILERLAESPATVTELIAHVDLSQPLVSWHLRTLKAIGLVETRRQGREVICSLRPDEIDRFTSRASGACSAWPARRTTMSDGSLLSNEKRNRFRAIVQPYAAGLARVGLTPNMLTLIGFGIAIAAAVLAGLELWLAAGIVSVVAGSFDMLDGAVARATGTSSKFGAFMDSTFDRWGEGVIYVGIVAGAAAAGSQLTAILAVLAAVCAFMVSYTRAKAEGLGFSGEVGIAPRPERIVILGAGLVATGLVGGPQDNGWLQLALGAIVVLTTITVIQRILHVRRQAAQTTPTKP